MKSITRFFYHKNRDNINQSYGFSLGHKQMKDELIDKSKKNCHESFGGYWEILTYKKPNGKIYTKHNVKCIKCDRIGTNLYSITERSPVFKKSLIENSISLRDKHSKEDSPRKSVTSHSEKLNSLNKKSSSRRRKPKKSSHQTPVIFSGKESSPYKCGIRYSIKVSSTKVPSTNGMTLTRHGYNISTMEISSSSDLSPPKNTELHS